MNREDFCQKGQFIILNKMTYTILKGWDCMLGTKRVGKFAITDGFHESATEAISIKWPPDILSDSDNYVSIYVHYKDLKFPSEVDLISASKPVYFKVQNLIV